MKELVKVSLTTWVMDFLNCVQAQSIPQSWKAVYVLSVTFPG